MARSADWRLKNFPVPEAHLLLLAAGVVMNRLMPARLGRGGVFRRAGWPLIAVGIGAAIWATRAAGGVDLEQPSRLVTQGPYARSRHPMYLGWTLIYLGVALVTANLWLLWLLPALAWLVDGEADREERRLQEAFGGEYEEYRFRVRRYL